MPAQSLPPLSHTASRNFTIPFEIDSDGTADPIKHVELLVSQDRGRHWNTVNRLPVEEKKFSYKAATDGEYWFAFRTLTASGKISPAPMYPQLRVAVDILAPPTPVNESREASPLTPPKPQKFREPGSESLTATPPVREEPASDNPQPEQSVTVNPQPAARNLPTFPDLEIAPAQSAAKQDDDLLGDILSNMDSFFDIQPARKDNKGNPTPTVAAQPQPKVAQQQTQPSTVPAGKITGLDLNPNGQKSQVIVTWNQGEPMWSDAQIDILRAENQNGPWQPISINLPNQGKYWWYITEEDLNPFFLTVRIRSIHSGTQSDTTAKVITINPGLLRR
ncbi:hypothetical protein FACS1894170_05230 [Planctomycetales bacterium]|nr:hypothetical protein FACS1894170_05230 [Planctomycetales bacterium]